MSKLVCGKVRGLLRAISWLTWSFAQPARPSDAADGWITAKVLGKYLQKAADQGWNGGWYVSGYARA